jgi:hypothetical protein
MILIALPYIPLTTARVVVQLKDEWREASFENDFVGDVRWGGLICQ